MDDDVQKLVEERREKRREKALDRFNRESRCIDQDLRTAHDFEFFEAFDADSSDHDDWEKTASLRDTWSRLVSRGCDVGDLGRLIRGAAEYAVWNEARSRKWDELGECL